MGIARRNLGPRLAAGLLKPRVGQGPARPLDPPRPIEEIEREIERVNWLRAHHPELSLVGAVMQARRELGVDA